MNGLATFASVAITPLVLSSAAYADIAVCNDFRARVRVALAFEDKGGFVSAGWWSVEPSACRDINFLFQGAALYYTADSDTYREGGSTKRDHWGNKKQLFVGRRDFKFDNADRSRRGAEASMFSQAAISEQLQSKPVAITIRFTAGNTTINVKAK